MPTYGSKEWFEKMFSPAQQGYDLWGHQWRASQEYRYLLSLAVIKHLLTKNFTQSILDIGCGLADFTYLMYGVNTQNKFYGMDISQNAITGAAKKYPEFHFQCNALPEIDHQVKFDGIISLDCVCYLNHQNRIDAVKNIFRHLKSKGWYLFSSPLDDGTRYFSEKNAIQVLRLAGFKIDHVCYNNARLYNSFEIPFLRISSLARIVSEIDRNTNQNLSPKKEKLRRLIKFPLLGNFLIKGARFSNRLSLLVLGSMSIVKFCQWISQKYPQSWGPSHIIILASKNE